MAAFPDFEIEADGFTFAELDGTEVDRADDGTLLARRMWPVPQYEITFRVFDLAAADIAAIRQFYWDNRDTTVEVTDPVTSITYEVTMLEPPRRVSTAGFRSVMEIRVSGVEQ